MFLRRNKKGQAAIFIVLVFQVLFILFAMSLNVAMVVYDKINLQNSLDLAAYYGAKKQAEVLNAMAHINYQMRQNWKLLAWRYRILGTLVQYTGDYHHPRFHQSCNPPPNNYYQGLYWCPQNQCSGTECRSNRYPPNHLCQKSQNLFSGLNLYPGYCDRNYFTCIGHDLWARGIPDSSLNLCTISGVRITPITSLPLAAPFMPEAHLAVSGVQTLISQTKASCPLEGALNWLTVQLFLTHFRLDQKDRKVMIKEIYNRTLKEGKDLDGEDIFKGTQRVFFGNLTKANRENVEGLPNRGLNEFQSFKDKNFNTFFDELHVRPILNYLDSTDSPNNHATASCSVQSIPHIYLQNSSIFQPSSANQINAFIQDRFERKTNVAGLPHMINPLKEVSSLFLYNMTFFDNTDPLAMLTLSFFKKTDQTLYYGLATDFEYKGENQIFSLNLSGIRFKGSAFAKAFGGSFGPQPEQSDPFIPTQNNLTPLKFVTSPAQVISYVHQPNYSRWPGDQWGLVDRRLHDPQLPQSFLNKHNNYRDTQKVYTIRDYFHIILGGITMDPLARSDPSDSQSFVRMMEWMAVYPDLYDINHYSILANYHQSYFPKICKLLLGGSDCDPEGSNAFTPTISGGGNNSNFFIRGDFGWPDSKEYIDRNQTRKQIDLSIAPYFLKQGDSINPSELKAPEYTPPPHVSHRYANNPDRLKGRHIPTLGSRPSPPLTQGNLFYPWLAGEFSGGGSEEGLPGGLLSSWFNPMPLNYKNYEFNNTNLDEYFLKCKHKALPGMPVSSSCVGLGRTGYSVKLISCDKVRQLSTQPDIIGDYCN